MVPAIFDIQPHRLLLKFALLSILGTQNNPPVITDSAAELHAVTRVAGKVDADVLVLGKLIDFELFDMARVFAVDEDDAVEGVVWPLLKAGVSYAGDGDACGSKVEGAGKENQGGCWEVHRDGPL